MFNPVKWAVTTFGYYVNFWENASTTQKITTHAVTLITVGLFRLSIHTTPATLPYAREMMVVVGITSHIFMAILTGKDATKKIDVNGLYQNTMSKLSSMEQQLQFVREDLDKLKKKLL